MYLHVCYLKQALLPISFVIALVLVSLLAQNTRDWFLPVMFLLLPFTDSTWQIPSVNLEKKLQRRYIILAIAMSILLFQSPELLGIFTVMVFISAVPEEWFFRAYLQKRLGGSMAAVLFVSLIFALLHFITQSSITAWLVFIPSIFFGWIYKKTSDLVLVVMLHAFSNLVFYIYLEAFIESFY